MLFYYLGPACAIFIIWNNKTAEPWPSHVMILKGCGISFWDVMAQTLNYTGASMAGPALFGIVYSSVTIWAALFSRLVLGRRMNLSQWMAVLCVFCGLALTANGSTTQGPNVWHGLLLVFLGSSMHGLSYVMSEAVMITGEEERGLTVEQNCAVQGLTASASFLLWQLVYTVPNAQSKLWIPMQANGTTVTMGLGLLLLFAAVNFLHSMTFYHALRHLSGGATSAGVFKGLQAVMVFGLTHLVYCGRIGGPEMCFSFQKFVSLVTVTAGVVGYGSATSERSNHEDYCVTNNNRHTGRTSIFGSFVDLESI
jgi:hypothetical protein